MHILFYEQAVSKRVTNMEKSILDEGKVKQPHDFTIFWQDPKQRTGTKEVETGLSIKVIILGNGISDSSSNPRLGC